MGVWVASGDVWAHPMLRGLVLEVCVGVLVASGDVWAHPVPQGLVLKVCGGCWSYLEMIGHVPCLPHPKS